MNRFVVTMHFLQKWSPFMARPALGLVLALALVFQTATMRTAWADSPPKGFCARMGIKLSFNLAWMMGTTTTVALMILMLQQRQELDTLQNKFEVERLTSGGGYGSNQVMELLVERLKGQPKAKVDEVISSLYGAAKTQIDEYRLHSLLQPLLPLASRGKRLEILQDTSMNPVLRAGWEQLWATELSDDEATPREITQAYNKLRAATDSNPNDPNAIRRLGGFVRNLSANATALSTGELDHWGNQFDRSTSVEARAEILKMLLETKHGHAKGLAEQLVEKEMGKNPDDPLRVADALIEKIATGMYPAANGQQSPVTANGYGYGNYYPGQATYPTMPSSLQPNLVPDMSAEQIPRRLLLAGLASGKALTRAIAANHLNRKDGLKSREEAEYLVNLVKKHDFAPEISGTMEPEADSLGPINLLLRNYDLEHPGEISLEPVQSILSKAPPPLPKFEPPPRQNGWPIKSRRRS